MVNPTSRYLNLGCGRKAYANWWNVDKLARKGVSQVYDLENTPWPWADRFFAEIRAFHIIEHLRIGLIPFCDECWRILAPGGVLHVKVPDAEDLDLA